jgi:amino acid permease
MLYVVDGIIVVGVVYMCFSSLSKKNIILEEYNSDNEVEQINSNYLTFDQNDNEIGSLV